MVSAPLRALESTEHVVGCGLPPKICDGVAFNGGGAATSPSPG
jgi:hypothetical protein